MMRYLILLGVLLLCGCSLSPSADVLQALGQDQASVCIRVTSVYGTLTVSRINSSMTDVSCNSDGAVSKSPGTAMGIPLTITPQFRVNQP